MQFVTQLVGDGTINSTHCLEALNKVLGQLVDLERATPALRSRVAHLVAWSVVEGKIMTLGELDETLKAQVNNYTWKERDRVSGLAFFRVPFLHIDCSM